jgi:membrane-associated phospholipid phosphatase
LIGRYGLGEFAATRALALLHMTAMDALIACFDAKYTYWFIRPTQADPGITLAAGIALPSHPAYPSAHSCLSGASAEILGALFPSEAAWISELADVAGLSRVYAGIHYQFDVAAGRALAHQVAQYALEVDRERGLLSALLTLAP